MLDLLKKTKDGQEAEFRLANRHVTLPGGADYSFVTATYVPCPLLRKPIVQPWLRGVRVAAHLPEAFLVFREELDPADPLRALPGVKLRRDHAARAAVFARQRFTFPRVD